MTETPKCFGKSWSANAVLCKGGLDPNYTNPRDGTHRRDQCIWYQQCAARTCATNLNSNPTVEPPRHLMRPPAQLPMMRPIPQQMPQQMVQQPPVHHLPVQQAHPGFPPGSHYYNTQHHSPVPYPAPGAQMPSYLSIPEPIDEAVHWGVRLVHEIFRSMMKSTGHTTAAFFDHTTISRRRSDK